MVLRTLLLLFIGASLAATRAGATCDAPRCFDMVVPVPRRLTVPDSTVRVILPAGYGDSRVRYPVLYLLHGAGDTYASWTEKTDVQEFSRQLPLIIVMPDGGHDRNAGFYSDWVDGSRQWETFHTRVLPRWVERHFRTLRGGRHRAVAGLSMGGFGAMSYAARHPGLFRAAASFSGAVDTLYGDAPAPILFAAGVVQLGVWGDPVADARTWRAHDPVDLARRLRGTALFVATGDGTPGGPAGDVDDDLAYLAEQVIAGMNHAFAEGLDAAGVSFARDFYHGGYHGWPYWQRELHWSLPQIMRFIGR